MCRPIVAGQDLDRRTRVVVAFRASRRMAHPLLIFSATRRRAASAARWWRGGTMLESAVRWIRRHALAGGGIAVSSKQHVSYPEVTGYFIPTLLALGERDLARAFSEWLVRAQRPDGAFAGPGMDETFAFDTGQVVRGWVAL